ncbi:hypothetical protein Clacol_006940 [Clathrus columnatus]|uniref:Uncharacterized protein n=1 Tax=Clathrus columnatus TaxID=1419009 RepID=A0AAV5AJQ6_9AGAM|nr:hypothetical protein Clacol_006940 [Clathrus columnatus]
MFSHIVFFGGLYLLYGAIGRFIRGCFIAKLTALNEFAEIGSKSTRKSHKLHGTAVVCGGSISGLLTAKVCSDHFENVTIVEAEEWVTKPKGYTGSHRKELADKKRSHVSQYTAIHSFQSLLIATILKWFPNLNEECEKVGARPGFETLLRRLIMHSCENVRYLAGTALGLEQASGSDQVTGVHIRTAEGKRVTLSAALVIDCTGASSSGLRWLKDLAAVAGNEKALEKLNNLRQTYNPKQSYYTCEFKVSPEAVSRLSEVGYPGDWDSSGVIFANFVDSKLDNKLLGIEIKDNNYLHFVLGGWSVTEEVSNMQDIRSFINSFKVYKPLPVWIWTMLDVLEEYNVPLSIEYSRVASYIQYNLYNLMPSNFIAIGDSVMRLNPIRGTGCVKACVEVLTLNGILNGCTAQKGTEGSTGLPEDFSKRFCELQASRTSSEWNAYKAEDYAWTTTIPSKGEDPQIFGKSHRAFSRLIIQTALNDKEFAVTLGCVRGFMAPSTDLLTPKMLWKLFKVKLLHKSPML